MNLVVDPNARSPLYRQIQDQIRYAISVGDLMPGDALPSIRELEERLDVNRNTVRRAYLELQIQGTLVIRQGREAIVAERPPVSSEVDPQALGEAAESLTELMLRQAESIGVDCVQLADCVMHAARQHDATYPRCAFAECSLRQAEDFARHTQEHFGRRVVGVDLHDLESDPDAMPTSIRFVLTPHWHAAEANAILESEHQAVFALGVRITDACGRQLRALKGAAVGLVVRDAESMPGFRERLRSHIGRKPIAAAVAGDRAAVSSLMGEVEHVVYTSPCAEVVRALAPGGVDAHELLFEPVPEDLDAIKSEIFPPLVQHAQPA